MQGSNHYRGFALPGVVLAIGVAATPCVAQSSDGAVDEITITATHFRTRLQDTPLAVSAFTSQQLSGSGVRDISDLAAYTPGLTIGTGEGQGAVPISIRGVGQNDLGIGADAPIAIYLDGVYLARPYMNLFDLVDVERIEVLRGPQGTLYGRNATGGAINVVTRRPNETLAAEASARFGGFNAWGAQGWVTGPLGEAWSGKLAVAASGRDGYTTNVLTGEDLDPERTFTVRGALRWRPSAALDVQLNADLNEHDMPVVLHNSASPSFDPKRIALDAQPREDRRTWGVSLEARYDLDGAQITSISGYRKARLSNVIDTDASPLNSIRFSQYDRTSQLSQELRVASDGEVRLQWLGGLYGFTERANTQSPIYLDFTANFGLASPTTQHITGANRTVALAVFGDARYRLTNTLSISAGLRWSRESKRFDFLQQFTVDLPPLFVSYPPSRQKTTWSSLSPRLGMEYRPRHDLLAYASYSKGFKSGGSTSVSLITSPKPNVFEPETLQAYEVGLKHTGLGGRVRVNASLFHYDYRNLQVRTTDSLGFLIVRNAATADIDGAELELAVRPSPRLEITASGALLDARYKHFVDPISQVDYSGGRLNRAPKAQVNLNAQYRYPLSDGGDLVFRAEYAHASRIYHQPGELLLFSRDPTHVFNGRVTLRGASGQWSVTAFGRNLTDRRYIGHAFPTLGEPRASITPPRVLGVELQVVR